MKREQRLGIAAAAVFFAAVAGGVAGWLFPWMASALAAAILVALAGGALWMHRRLNGIHRRLLAEQRTLNNVERLQRRASSKLAELEKVHRVELKRTHRALSKTIQARANAVTKSVAKSTTLEAQRTRRHADRLFRQLEALQSLHQLIEVRRALPPSRGWAASPDLLLTYVEEILAQNPRCVVECGSGLSTVWAAYAVQSLGGSGRVVALDHDAEFAEKTRAMLAEHGLSELAEVRHAPLTPVDLPAGSWPWYDTAALKDVQDVGVVLVDGPPKPTAVQARYPAIPVLREQLVPGAVVLVDDTAREDEQAILQRWVAEWPELTCEQLPYEKGAARLVVPGR